MATPRVRDEHPVRQPVDVPDRMAPVANWPAGEAFMELWVDRRRGDGLILAVTRAGSERVGDISRARTSFDVTWCGSFAEKPATWLDAQAAVAHARFAGTSPL